MRWSLRRRLIANAELRWQKHGHALDCEGGKIPCFKDRAYAVLVSEFLGRDISREDVNYTRCARSQIGAAGPELETTCPSSLSR